MKRLLAFMLALLFLAAGCSFNAARPATDGGDMFDALAEGRPTSTEGMGVPASSSASTAARPAIEVTTSTPKPTPIIKQSYAINEVLTDFSAGRAWVSYYDDESKLHYAVIDTTGGVIYSVSYDSLAEWRDIEAAIYDDGICCIWSGSERTRSSSGMIVTDKNGNIVFSTLEDMGDSSYYYLGYGDGTILAVENIQNFSENSNWLCEISLSGEKTKCCSLSTFEYMYDDYRYLGEGYFIGGAGYNIFLDEVYYVYDRDTRKIIYTDTFVILQPFKNGQTIGGIITDKYQNNRVGLVYSITTDEIRDAEKTGELNRSQLNKIGEYNVSPELMTERLINNPYKKGQFGFYGETSGIYSFQGDLLAAYPENWNVRNASGFSGGYAGLELVGADGKSYITIVNLNGEQQYTPIQIENWADNKQSKSIYIPIIWNGYVSVTKNGKETILDPTGTESSLQTIYGISSSFSIGNHVVREGFERQYDESKKRYVSLIRSDGMVLDTVYVISNHETTKNQGSSLHVQTEVPIKETTKPSKQYITPSSFAIEGKWKNTGTYTFGQVQDGAIVVFDGKNCNVFSPMDTYAFYKSGSDFRLDCTSYLFSDTLSFTVKIIDNDHIDIYYGSNCLELTRVS